MRGLWFLLALILFSACTIGGAKFGPSREGVDVLTSRGLVPFPDKDVYKLKDLHPGITEEERKKSVMSCNVAKMTCVISYCGDREEWPDGVDPDEERFNIRTIKADGWSFVHRLVNCEGS